MVDDVLEGGIWSPSGPDGLLAVVVALDQRRAVEVADAGTAAGST
jgi:hypothetical protein